MQTGVCGDSILVASCIALFLGAFLQCMLHLLTELKFVETFSVSLVMKILIAILHSGLNYKAFAA